MRTEESAHTRTMSVHSLTENSAEHETTENGGQAKEMRTVVLVEAEAVGLVVVLGVGVAVEAGEVGLWVAFSAGGATTDTAAWQARMTTSSKRIPRLVH